MKLEMKFIRYFTATDQSARYYTWFTVHCEKVEYSTVWSEWTNQLTITLFHWCPVKKVRYYADWSQRSTQTVDWNNRNDENSI